MKKNVLSKIALIAIIAVSVLFIGCSKKEQPAEAKGRPNDGKPAVIVVGSGLSGHSAVYSALEAGATVLWVEKNPELGGTSKFASGTFSAAETKLQKDKGIEDSFELFTEDVNRVGHNKADKDLLKIYVEKATTMWEWMVEKGLEVSEKSPFIDPVHSPYSVPRTNTPAKNSAYEYCRVLRQEMAAFEDSLSIMTSTEASRLIQEGDKVVGIETTGGKTLKADAVILCTGGFGSNPAFIEERMPKYKELRHVTPPHANGSGIIMAEEIGADIVNMDFLVSYFGAIAEEGTKSASFGSLTSGVADRWKGEIWVDYDGNRFVDEDGFDEDPREVAIDNIKEQTTFIIFDQGMIDANGGQPPLRNFEEWLAKDFGVKKADSLKELAEAFGIDTAGLMATVTKNNKAAKTGIDTEFGKEVNLPLSTAPFYGIKSYGTIFMTQGGVKTTTLMEAVLTSGNVIPGLYAAGEVQGSTQWGGQGLAGGSGTTPALVFGREAGKNAVEYSLK